ncbi:MAG: hypothetical protein UV34_C0005G0017 [Parcubacteria group bacterium GW2011_GWB1_42_6]|nr:MAG: hypothetical protein UV34_C0005G0017 [Parcubacteria group bacterium GW2011_GWB1_42_6]
MSSFSSLRRRMISKKGIYLFAAATIIVSGFFIADFVLADHIFSVTASPEAVNSENASIISFDISSDGGPNIKTIAISEKGTGFGNPASVTCPSGWNIVPPLPPILNGYVCMDPSEIGLPSASVILNGMTAPALASEKNFSVSAINADDQNENKNVPVNVKTLNAAAQVSPASINTEQIKNITLNITNPAGDLPEYADIIDQITGNFGEIAINSCSSDGWTCAVADNAFALTGGSLTPGESINIIFADAQAPAAPGFQDISLQIKGSLGMIKSIISDPAQIAIQTPASLTIDAVEITSEFPAISNQTGAKNITIISAIIENEGQATAILNQKSLEIFSDPEISFLGLTILETDSIDEIDGETNVALTWTITATPEATEGVADAKVAINYADSNDSAINSVSQTKEEIFEVDNTAPALSAVSISSNNNNPSKAKAGDIITLSITANENIQTPVVSIAGHGDSIIIDGQNNLWTASYAMSESDAEGIIVFSIDYKDLAENAGNPVSATTEPATNVTFDKTNPTFSISSVIPDLVKIGTFVSISFTAGEVLAENPIVTIGRRTAGQTQGTPDYIYELELDGTEGSPAAILISGIDPTGNIGTGAANINTDFISPSVNLTYDPDKPVKDSDTVVITASFTENLGGTPKISIDTPTADVENADMSGSEMNWTYSWNVPEGDGQAVITISASDPAGNQNNPATNNTRTIDNTLPAITATTLNGIAADLSFNPGLANIITEANEPVDWLSARIYISDDPIVYYKEKYPAGDGTQTTSFDWDGGLTPDGTPSHDGIYNIRTHIVDLAGNDAGNIVLPFTITVDTADPVVNISSAQENSVVVGNLNIDISGVTGADFCAYSFDEGATETSIDCDTAIIPISDLEGRQTLTFYGRDNAGNEAFDAIDFIANNDGILTVGSGEIYDFNDIQSAINAAIDGDLIDIAAGIYEETLNLDKSLILDGAAGNIAIIQPESNNDGIIVTADNAIIKDLQILTSNSGLNPNIAIRIEGANNIEINDNAITTTGNKAMGIWIGGIGYDNSHNLKIIGNNIVINNEATGIYAEGGTAAQTGWEIKSNVITAVSSNPLEMYDVSDSEVSGNTLTITAPVNASNVMWFSELSNLSNLVFNNNLISGSTGSEVAIGTDFREDGPFADSPATSIANISISGNTFSNWGSRALRIGKVGTGTVNGVIVNDNKFLSAGQAINNFDDSEINAEKNWWGTTDGAAIDSKIDGEVDYRPWRISDDLTYAVDFGSPSIIISSAVLSPTNLASIPISINFTEPAYDFIVNDIIATNGTKSLLSGSGSNYSLNIDPENAGNITIQVNAGAIWDESGNYNEQSNILEIYYDNAAPAGYSAAIGQEYINEENQNALSFAFAGAETGTTYHYSIDDSTPGSPIEGNGIITANDQTIEAVDVSSLQDGMLNLNVYLVDAAGNEGESAVDSVLKDTVAPSFTVVDPVSAQPVKTDTINIAVAEINPDTSEYGFSSNEACSDVAEWISFVSETDFFVAGDHTDFLCAKAVDIAGNSRTQLIGRMNTDNTNPELMLNSLFTNQTVNGGQIYPISWVSSDSNQKPLPIKIEYTLNNEMSWIAAISETENDGSYSWTVPTVNSSNCKIRITAADLAENYSQAPSSVFSIIYSEIADLTAPTVTLNIPNGGEEWLAGSSHVIIWTATDNLTSSNNIGIKLEYSLDGSAGWDFIEESTENDGVYVWNIPEGTESDEVLVKITAIDLFGNAGSDLSNNIFRIVPPPFIPQPICSNSGSGIWSCDIAMSAGWNLISLPVIITNTDIESVLSEIYDEINLVKYYDWNEADLWKTYSPAGGGDLTSMEDGKGYWIFMNSPATLNVAGTEMEEPPAMSPIYHVYPGWNLIGFKSVSARMLALDYLQSLAGTGYILMDKSNINKNDGYMASGEGYWLWMNREGDIVTFNE